MTEYLRFIAANTRRIRALRRMTQATLAEMADLDLRFLQRIEAATTNLTVSVLVALADALGVAPAALMKRATLPPTRRGRPPSAIASSERNERRHR